MTRRAARGRHSSPARSPLCRGARRARSARRARAHADPVAAAVRRSSAASCCSPARSSTSRAAPSAGFARGEAAVDGLGADGAPCCALRFQNEHLVAELDGEVVATTPDLICVLDTETGEPVTTEGCATASGSPCSARPADPRWHSPEGIALVGPRYFGYDLDYVPRCRRGRRRRVPRTRRRRRDGRERPRHHRPARRRPPPPGRPRRTPHRAATSSSCACPRHRSSTTTPALFGPPAFGLVHATSADLHVYSTTNSALARTRSTLTARAPARRPARAAPRRPSPDQTARAAPRRPSPDRVPRRAAPARPARAAHAAPRCPAARPPPRTAPPAPHRARPSRSPRVSVCVRDLVAHPVLDGASVLAGAGGLDRAVDDLSWHAGGELGACARHLVVCAPARSRPSTGSRRLFGGRRQAVPRRC